MSQNVRSQKPISIDKARSKKTPARKSDRLDENVSGEGWRDDESADKQLKRWKDKAFMCLFLLASVILCIVWAIVFLSHNFSPDHKDQVTDLFKYLIVALLGVLAGRGTKS